MEEEEEERKKETIMPSLVATTSTPAREPFVRTHYVRTKIVKVHSVNGLEDLGEEILCVEYGGKKHQC